MGGGDEVLDRLVVGDRGSRCARGASSLGMSLSLLRTRGQQLERALLIGVEGGGSLYYFATRLGQAALERDAVNRVLTGGTL